jgi:hypothetical protein
MLPFNSIVNHKTVVFDSVCSAWLVPFQVHTALFIPVGIAALILTYLYLTQKYRWASYVSWSMFTIELCGYVFYDYDTVPKVCMLLAVVALGVYTNSSCTGVDSTDLSRGYTPKRTIEDKPKVRKAALVRNFHIGIMYISLFNLALFCIYVESFCLNKSGRQNQTHKLFRPFALILAIIGTCILSFLRESDTADNHTTDYRGTVNPWRFW